MRPCLVLIALLSVVCCTLSAQAQSPLTCSGVWCAITSTENRDGAGSFLSFQAPSSLNVTRDYALLNGGRLGSDNDGDLDLLVLRGGRLSGIGIAGASATIAPSDPGWWLGGDFANPGASQFRGLRIAGDDRDGGDSRSLDVRIDNRATDPAGAGSVTAYFTHNRWSFGPGFALVAEIQDVLGVGPIWAEEIDVFSAGAGITDDTMQRRGLGIVIGRSVAGGLRDTTIGYGIDILPFYRDRDHVDVGYGLNVGVHCRIACIAVPVGEKISLSGDGVISLRYNSQTGRIEFLRGDVVKSSIDMR
jgi:hypothetical protein